MRNKRFSVEQMIGVLEQAEVGVPVAEVIGKAGIGEQTFYRWKAKYTGLEWTKFGRWHSCKVSVPSSPVDMPIE
jgi:hypothetical protein